MESNLMKSGSISSDPNEMWTVWKNLFLEVLNKHAPLDNIKIKGSNLPYITSEVRQLARQCDFSRKKARKSIDRYLGMIPDSKLTFLSHIKKAIVKARRGIGIIRFLSKYVARDVLDQIYKLYVRPHLDYGDIIYHKYDPEFKLDFTKRLESTQYSAALAVSRAWREKNRQDLRRTWLGNPLL